MLILKYVIFNINNVKIFYILIYFMVYMSEELSFTNDEPRIFVKM